MSTPSGISVFITRVLALTPYGFFVQWEVRRPSASGEYKFWVYRSGSSEGPWEPVGEALTEKYCVVDRFDQPHSIGGNIRRPNQLALFRQFYYRVVMLAPNGERDEMATDSDPPMNEKGMQHWRRMQKNFQDMLRLNGRPCCVLKRRRWGKRCPKCSDAVLKEPLKSSCTVCWGTGFEGGFWAPVRILANRVGQGDTNINTPEQRSDTRAVRIMIQSFPDVERDDLFVFPHDRRRYIVESVKIPEILHNGTHQTIVATELAASNVLYRLRVDDDAVAPLV